VKWTSEASAGKRKKNFLEQLTVAFHAHSPKLKQSPTEALVHTVVHLTDKNLPKLSAYNTWLSYSRASPLSSTEKLLRLSTSDTNYRTNQNLKTSAHRLAATGHQKKIADDPSKKRRKR